MGKILVEELLQILVCVLGPDDSQQPKKNQRMLLIKLISTKPLSYII